MSRWSSFNCADRNWLAIDYSLIRIGQNHKWKSKELQKNTIGVGQFANIVSGHLAFETPSFNQGVLMPLSDESARGVTQYLKRDVFHSFNKFRRTVGRPPPAWFGMQWFPKFDSCASYKKLPLLIDQCALMTKTSGNYRQHQVHLRLFPAAIHAPQRSSFLHFELEHEPPVYTHRKGPIIKSCRPHFWDHAPTRLAQGCRF